MKSFSEVYQCDSITLNITNKCNLNCTYCFEHYKDNKMMDSKLAIDIIDETYNHRYTESQGVFTINIFGGEPLLNWSCIKDIVDHCNDKEYNVKFGITSNLTILTDEMIKYIDENNIMILVSIDGVKYIHDKNRCNSYDKVEANIKRLIDNDCGSLIEARMTIDHDSVYEMYNGVLNIWNMGISNICPMPVTDCEWSNEELQEFKAQYRKILEFYTDTLNDEDNERNIYIKNTDEIIGNVLDPLVGDPHMCPINKNRWAVFDVDGDVYQCHQITYEENAKSKSIGNIYTGIDESKMIKEDLLAKFKNKDCISCNAKGICHNGCPSENMRMNNSYNKPSESFCKIYKAYSEVAKEFTDVIKNMNTDHSRFLNIVKMNIQLKEYYDNEVCSAPLMSEEYILKAMHFKELKDDLGNKLLPTFEQYFISKHIMAFKLFAKEITDMMKGVMDNGKS